MNIARPNNTLPKSPIAPGIGTTCAVATVPTKLLVVNSPLSDRTLAIAEAESKSGGAGGQFDGWSYASTIQIQFFISNAGGTIPMSGWSSANNGVVAPLLNLWGTTQPFAESWLINGTFILGNPSVTVLSDDPNQSQHLSQDFISLNQTTIAASGSSPTYGSALLRSSSSVVPLPASGWLFITALVGLVGKKQWRC